MHHFDISQEVVPPEYLSSVVCLSCFARLADEKVAQWDRDIRLYPLSMYTHLTGVNTYPASRIAELTPAGWQS